MNSLQANFSVNVSKTEFLAAMQKIPSSVTVVTTSGKAGRHGATVSAFCSVSIAPPTVLVCLNSASRIARMVESNGLFSINVLNFHHQQLIHRFAGAYDNNLEDRFAGIDTLEPILNHAPILKDCIALSCNVTQVIQQQTHLVFFGEVVNIQNPDSNPIVFFKGSAQSLVFNSAVEEKMHAYN